MSTYYSYYQNNPADTTVEQIKNKSITKDIESWLVQVEQLKKEVVNFNTQDEEKYIQWLDQSIKRYAPGYLDYDLGNGGVLTPKQVGSPRNKGALLSSTPKSHISTSDSFSQLNEVFQNINMK